jgi:predicted XRE-type DNA-binding protein
MSEEIKVEKSSGNVFKDLGFPDEEAERELLKAELGLEIFRILKKRNLTQTQTAEILGVNQSEISRLKAGKFSYYSVERLMRFLDRLNCDVTIHIANLEDGAERVIAI